MKIYCQKKFPLIFKWLSRPFYKKEAAGYKPGRSTTLLQQSAAFNN
jgi:hypothetical protein